MHVRFRHAFLRAESTRSGLFSLETLAFRLQSNRTVQRCTLDAAKHSTLETKTMQHVDRQQQIFAALQIVHAVGEAIQELGSVPSGTLYARLMDQMRLDRYEQIIGLLKTARLVEESNEHLLTWIGPKAVVLRTAVEANIEDGTLAYDDVKSVAHD